MKTKEFDVNYKDEGSGSIEGYASTWIRKADSWGDVVAKGAFEKTLAERWNGGKGIPFIWSHQIDNLKSFIGTAEADEDDKGLHFVATFDDTEEAQKVRLLLRLVDGDGNGIRPGRRAFRGRHQQRQAERDLCA